MNAAMDHADAGSDHQPHDHADANGEECLLCKVDCRPEAYGITPSATHSLRQLMLIEASNFGMVPDELLFRKVAEAYREIIYNPATDRGEDVPLWTPMDVEHHFTKCVSLLPRRNLTNSIKSLERIEKHLRIKELYQKDEVTGQKEICPKALDSYLKVQKTKLDMQKTLMGINKLDAGHIEASKLGVASGDLGAAAGGSLDADVEMTGESMFA